MHPPGAIIFHTTISTIPLLPDTTLPCHVYLKGIPEYQLAIGPTAAPQVDTRILEKPLALTAGTRFSQGVNSGASKDNPMHPRPLIRFLDRYVVARKKAILPAQGACKMQPFLRTPLFQVSTLPSGSGYTKTAVEHRVRRSMKAARTRHNITV